MKQQTLEVSPDHLPRRVRDAEGRALDVPDDWELLPPGDAAVTRAVKAAAPTWTVIMKRGRKRFSQGIWAPAEAIAEARAKVAAKRAAPQYQSQRRSALRRRAQRQAAYEVGFEEAVSRFLDFHADHEALARKLARLVAAQATPIGSGTVARTERIPLDERAERAVIAWLRHHTTAYESLKIPRIKGRRREVRRELARSSRSLLGRYRSGMSIPDDCPLLRALRSFDDDDVSEPQGRGSCDPP